MKIYMVCLGCAKNQADSETVINFFEKSGHELTFDEREAQAVIIMTCAFIEQARKEAEETIKEFITKKKRYGFHLLVGGCYAKRFSTIMKERFPELDAWFGISGFEQIGNILTSVKNGQTGDFTSSPDIVYPEYSGRHLITPSHWAWLKIADGCNHACAFCAIPEIRGSYRSKTIESILREAQELAENGVKELLLIAQDTGLYGKDLYGKVKLVNLLEKLCAIEKIAWIRLLYINPYSLSEELVDFIAGTEKMVKYLDIPFQHSSKKILTSMRRPGNGEEYLKLLENMRNKIPDLAVRSSFIVGFPGETKLDFEELKSFIQEAKINRAGFFIYSDEEGTTSYSYSDKVSLSEKNARLDDIARIQRRISLDISKQRLGKVLPVIVDSEKSAGLTARLVELFGNIRLAKGISHIGRTAWDAPEVDGLVFIKTSRKNVLKNGDIVNLKIIKSSVYDVLGDYSN